MLVYCSAPEDFPPRRADVVELFFVQLAARGIRSTWHLRSRRATNIRTSIHLGQKVLVSATNSAAGKVEKLYNMLLYWISDIPFFIEAGKKGQVLQARDKYFAALIALVVGRLKHRTVIYWCSYPFPEHAREIADLQLTPLRSVLGRVTSRLAAWWLYAFIMPRMDHIFVQSDEMLAAISSYGIPIEKMTAVPMGVPKSLLDERHPARNVRVVPNRVVYLGSLGRARRLETLIDAFALVVARIPGALLVMVGDGDVPAERASLEAYVRSRDIESRVEFTGQLPSADAWQRVGEAAVCVSPIYPSPTLRQGSPTKLLEYMALGKPTVANDHPEQSKVLAESGAGICVPWDATAFANAICELIENPSRAAEMAARGPTWIAANRTYDHLADLVCAKYKEIVGVV